MNREEEEYILSLIPEEGISAPDLGDIICPSLDPNVRRAAAYRKLRKLSDRGLLKKTFVVGSSAHVWKKVVE